MKLRTHATLITLATLVLSGCNLIQPNQTRPASTHPPATQSPDNPNPYSIEHLRNRSFENATLTQQDRLASYPNFDSYLGTYSYDNLTLRTLINIPKGDPPPNGWPVLFMNHGYVNPATYSTLSTYSSITNEFSNRGYLVLKPDYRCHGESDCPSDSALNRLLYPQDVLALLHAIQSVPQANPNQIFMVGHSMGGNVTLKVLEATDQITAASLWAPVAAAFPESLMYYVTRFESQPFIEQTQREIDTFFPTPEDIQAVSALDQIKHLTTPLNIHHGTADNRAPYEWSQTLHQELSIIDHSHQFYTYQGDDHNFTRGSWDTVVQRDTAFFRNQQ